MVNICFYTLMGSCLHQVCKVSGSIGACAAALQLHIMADAPQLACELQADVVPGRLDSNQADDPNLFIPVLCLIGNIISWRMFTCIINGLILKNNEANLMRLYPCLGLQTSVTISAIYHSFPGGGGSSYIFSQLTRMYRCARLVSKSVTPEITRCNKSLRSFWAKDCIGNLSGPKIM